MKRRLGATAAFALLGAQALADDVTDSIEGALAAYKDGDLQYALEELAYATQLLNAMKSDDLSALMPPAPEGWTRELDPTYTQSLNAMGGGVGVSASYRKGPESFGISLTADSPMVAAMAPMLLNAGMLGGKMIRVGREKFVDQDGQIIGLIGNRVLIQVDNTVPEVIIPILEAMDFEAVANLGN